MSDETEYVEGGRRRAKKRRGPAGCLAVLVALAVVVAGFWFAVDRGTDWISDRFADAEDYPGPGTGEVTFEVQEGDTATAIGRNLKDAGVVPNARVTVETTPPTPSPSRRASRWATTRSRRRCPPRARSTCSSTPPT